MLRCIAVALCICLTGCVYSESWTKTDTAYEVAYLAAVAADAYTTTQIQYHDGMFEDQPITRGVLGTKPATSDTWQYFATMALSHYLISRVLPERYRRLWQVGGIGYHGYWVLQNCEAGLCSSRPEPKPPPKPSCGLMCLVK